MLHTSITFDDISPYRLSPSRLNYLLDMLDNLHICATLFVIPKDFGKDYSKNRDFRDCLQKALDSGHELAQHGYVHIENEYFGEFGNLLSLPYPTYRKQQEFIESGKERFVELTGVEPYGFRAPCYLHSKITIKALSNAGFRYDSSDTVFKPAHIGSMRIRVLRNLKLQARGVLEIPVTGDYTLYKNIINLQFCLRCALADFKLLESRNGVCVLNNHPNHVDIDFIFQFLKSFIEKVGKETEFVRLCDIKNSLA